MWLHHAALRLLPSLRRLNAGTAPGGFNLKKIEVLYLPSLKRAGLWGDPETTSKHPPKNLKLIKRK